MGPEKLGNWTEWTELNELNWGTQPSATKWTGWTGNWPDQAGNLNWTNFFKWFWTEFVPFWHYSTPWTSKQAQPSKHTIHPLRQWTLGWWAGFSLGGTKNCSSAPPKQLDTWWIGLSLSKGTVYFIGRNFTPSWGPFYLYLFLQPCCHKIISSL